VSQFPGTDGYQEQAPQLLLRYGRLAPELAFEAALHLFPKDPCCVLDVGAGTGVFAAWLAKQGHAVVAVEPTEGMRSLGMAHNNHSGITWMEDGLPSLADVKALGKVFDLTLLSSVWMHLDQTEREEGFGVLASLLAPHGRIIMTLRHGPVPKGRRMFEVSADETLSLASKHGLEILLNEHRPSLQEPNISLGVTWTFLAFQKPVA